MKRSVGKVYSVTKETVERIKSNIHLHSSGHVPEVGDLFIIVHAPHFNSVNIVSVDTVTVWFNGVDLGEGSYKHGLLMDHVEDLPEGIIVESDPLPHTRSVRYREKHRDIGREFNVYRKTLSFISSGVWRFTYILRPPRNAKWMHYQHGEIAILVNDSIADGMITPLHDGFAVSPAPMPTGAKPRAGTLLREGLLDGHLVYKIDYRTFEKMVEIVFDKEYDFIGENEAHSDSYYHISPGTDYYDEMVREDLGDWINGDYGASWQNLVLEMRMRNAIPDGHIFIET